MILFLYGQDTFRSRTRLHELIDKFKTDRDPEVMNVVRLDCEKADASEMLNQITASPFLSEKRMVVLEHLLLSKQKIAQEEVLRIIEEKRVPDSTVLVFWEGTDAFKTKESKAMFDRLLQEKYAQKFDPLSGVKLSAWIAEEVEARGGNIAKDAVQFLAEHAGGDTWRVSSVIEQVMAYVLESPLPSEGRDRERSGEEPSQNGRDPSPALPLRQAQGRLYKGREITISDVQLFLEERADDNIFALVDAIVAKNSNDVFQMIDEQYRQGKEALYLLAMITRQFRILLQLRDLMEREDGLSSDVLAKQLGLHPFVVKKSLPMAKRYTMTELRDIYGRLLTLDVSMKSGGMDGRALLDICVGRMVTDVHRR